MATTILREGHDEEKDIDFAEVRFDNGDHEAIQEIIKSWNFKDKQSALRFALAVLRLAKPGNLCRLDSQKNSEVINPNPELLK